MANDALLVLRIVTDARDAAAGLNDASTNVSGFQKNLNKTAAAAGVAGAAVVAFGVSAAKAAAEDAQGQAILAQALKNSTGARDSDIASVEDWISKTAAATGVADDQLRPALGTLARATGDVAKSQELMNTALDVSAATGTDLESVSNALAKAYAGNTASLGKLVPGIDKAVLASGDMNAIMAELARTTGGSAAAAAETAAGKMQRMQLAMDETKESIGAALLPAFDRLAAVMLSVATWAQNNSTAFVILLGVVGALAVAVLAYSAATKVAAAVTGIATAAQWAWNAAANIGNTTAGVAIGLAGLAVAAWIRSTAATVANTAATIAHAAATGAVAAATAIWTAAQWLLNAAFLASPITWIVLAVVGLIAVIVLIATKTTWFQDIWNAAWDAISGAIKAVWNWISSNWPLLLTILTGPIGAAVALIVRNWDSIKAAAQTVYDFIAGAMTSVWGTMSTAAKIALDILLTPIRAIQSAIEGVIGAVRNLIDWIGKIKIPDVGSIIDKLNPFSASLPFTPPGPSAVGFAPLSASRYGARSVTGAGVAFGATRVPGNGGLTINVNGALDPVAVAQQIRRILRDDARRSGGVVIA